MMKLFALITLIISIQSISSWEVTRQDEIKLPGMERISRRSVPSIDEDVQIRIIRDAKDDMDTAANTIVFRPLFRRRNNLRRIRRANDGMENTISDNLVRTARSTQFNDIQTAPNPKNIVFRPFFRKHNNRRVTRSTNPQNDMETAANTIVFRPFFRRHNNRRVSRSVQENNKIVSNERAARSIDLQNDMETAANTIVFRPFFRRRNGFRRNRRSIEDGLPIVRKTRALYRENDEVMDVAANIVFRPFFKSQNRYLRF